MVVFCWAVAVGAEAAAANTTATAPHVRVTYEGISEKQAQAIADVVSAARESYTGEFGADMPETLLCTVRCGAANEMRLFNDGKDSISLSMPTAQKLAPPAQSGAFVLYGLCHELGHLAMYRTLKDRDWLTGAGAEGWAHYAGSVVVDLVWEAKGEKIWSEPYDYRADGTRRLEKQLKAAKPSDVASAAGEWQKLGAIIGRKDFVKVFAAWQSAKIDLASPGTVLLAAAQEAAPADKKEAVSKWWKSAASLLAEARPSSGFKRVEIAPGKLTGQPVKIINDDGSAEGKKSIAGGGHARLFEAPGSGEWCLRAISIYGARYGAAAPPAMDFDLALCDVEMKPIATWKHPYKLFERGEMKWVRIEVPPTLTPGNFYVCAVFRPTASSGVFVGYDDSTHGNSQTATPGKNGEEFKAGDWMMRVEVDRVKGADALKEQQ
jgi:hypothetical protein